MKHYQNSVIDTKGNAVTNATITVRTLDNVDTEVFSNSLGTVSLGSTVQTNALGQFSFYALPGRYNLAVSGAGISSYSLNDVDLYDPCINLADSCKGDGITDDTTAINSALAKGAILDGGGLTYAVSGNIILPAITRIRNATFKQLAPSSTSRRTLFQQNGTLCKLENVYVNRNGTGLSGSISDAAGIWISSCDRVELDYVEVSGNDAGNGIAIVDCNHVKLNNPYIHDIKAGNASSAVVTDDNINGIWISRGSKVTIVSPRVQSLKNTWTGQAEINRFSRGIAVGGVKNLTIIAPDVSNVDQGIDITGGEYAERITVVGGEVSDCYTWGHKAANTPRFISYIGCMTYRCGFAGFVASSPVSTLTAPYTSHIDYIGCQAIDTGYGGVWAANNVSGFYSLSSGTYADYPRSIRYTACTAYADISTMKYGFYSNAILGGVGDAWVETDNCTVFNATVKKYYGLHQGYSDKKRLAVLSVSNATWTQPTFDTVVLDRMSSGTGASNEVRILRSGVYLFDVQAEFAGNAAGDRKVRLLKNGTEIDGSQISIPAGNASSRLIKTSIIQALDEDDRIKIDVYQDSGGALNLTAAKIKTTLIQPGMGA